MRQKHNEDLELTMSTLLIDLLREEEPAAVLGSHTTAGDATVLVSRDHLLDVMRTLRDDPRCQMEVLADVTAVDYLEYEPGMRAGVSPVDAGLESGLTSDTLPRYEVVYHLLSMALRHRLRVKVPIAADDLWVPTLCELWQAANWGEREAWDMLGVEFRGHPDLRRVLNYEEFVGHPLRKDYPVRGYQPRLPMPELVHYGDNETYR